MLLAYYIKLVKNPTKNGRKGRIVNENHGLLCGGPVRLMTKKFANIHLLKK